MDEKWTFAHTVECSVSKDFAWSFWTNVSNWALDPDVISMELQGPFAVGTTGGARKARVQAASSGGLRSCSREEPSLSFPVQAC